MKTNIIIDLSNVVHSLRHSIFSKRNGVSYDKDYLFISVVDFVANMAKHFKASGVLIASDSKDVWRKDVYPLYKAGRKSSRDEYYEETNDVINNLFDFFDNYTCYHTIAVDRCEADDIIGVIGRDYWCDDVENIIISTDKDFVQLINEHTKLYWFVKGEFRSGEDSNFQLFLKLIRGDSGDSIPSSVPRIQEKKLREIFESKEEFVNLMESNNSRGEKVREVFERNNTLINLSNTPKELQDNIVEAIDNYNKTSNYNFVVTSRRLVDLGYGEMLESDDIDLDAFKRKFVNCNL